ncbi:IclR family transcriptional regulator C-terminal domain-containing protein [Pelagibius sp. Alg239-R121]|uniref:IclR family transcriptional regulator domain-containing protein n=1 Tax=Pelagibius sp. Alg239-R121 TaxID=2993448 RepID=UPI0024A643EC|nr:IclR family transcriptional regulator C-terminal domain-containing protein [Pelagibius sp. Alg239-R121]
MDSVDSVKTIRALERGLQVLELLGAGPTASLEDLHRRSGLAKATLLRILRTAIEAQWVHRRPSDGHYQLARAVQDLGNQIGREHILCEVGAPYLQDLQRVVGWPSDIAVSPSPGQVEILETSRFRAPFAINRLVVGFRPSMAFSALGRVYLAFLDPGEREPHLKWLAEFGRQHERRYVSSPAFRQELEETRERGYGRREPGYWGRVVDHGAELGAIAVPIFDGERVQAALNLVWIGSVMSQEEVTARYLNRLKTAADAISTVVSGEAVKA